MKKSAAEKILADFRNPNGDIDLNGYLESRGFRSFVSTARGFNYDNDATDTQIVLNIVDEPNCSSAISTNHSLSYAVFRAKTDCRAVLLKYWPDQLAREELSDIDNYGKSCTEENAVVGLFCMPIMAICHMVELAEEYGSKD